LSTTASFSTRIENDEDMGALSSSSVRPSVRSSTKIHSPSTAFSPSSPSSPSGAAGTLGAAESCAVARGGSAATTRIVTANTGIDRRYW
jgi:hypothetical protein